MMWGEETGDAVSDLVHTRGVQLSLMSTDKPVLSLLLERVWNISYISIAFTIVTTVKGKTHT